MQNNTFHNFIKNLVAFYADKLGVNDYHYLVNISNKQRTGKNCKNSETFATVLVDEETREVYLHINKHLAETKPEELHKTISHEVLHVRLNELLNFMNIIIQKHVKDDKSREVYRSQLELLEHKIIIPLSEVLSKDAKTN